LNSGDRTVRLAVFGIGLLLLALPVQAATVLSVGDGDTITVTNGAQKIRVRLACIDAPETSQSLYGMEWGCPGFVDRSLGVTP